MATQYMSILPRATELGLLQMVEVYEFYDRPVLFACRNLLDTYYLVTLDDDDDDGETWLYAPMSISRFQHIRSGHIDLHDAFTLAEESRVALVRTPNNRDLDSSIEWLNASAIPADRLPEGGETLSLQTQTLPSATRDLITIAQSTYRTRLNLELDIPALIRTEAPAKSIGQVMISIQDVIDVLGKNFSTLYGQSPRLTEDLRNQMRLLIVGFSAASFNLELAAQSRPNVLQEALIELALEELVKLITNAREQEILKTQLSTLSKEVAIQYLKFLKSVRDANSNNTYLAWASPVRSEISTARISSIAVIEAISFLDQLSESKTDTLQLQGMLTGLMTDPPRKFQLTVGDDIYKGDVEIEDVNDFTVMRQATLGKRYQAVIRETTTVKLATEDVKIERTLLRLIPI